LNFEAKAFSLSAGILLSVRWKSGHLRARPIPKLLADVGGFVVLTFIVSLMLAAPPPPTTKTPPPTPEPTVAALVAELNTCLEMDCVPLKTLISKGEKVWPELAVGLDSPDEMVRFWTLGVLTEVPVAAARPRLIGLLKDPLVRIRAATAFALGAQRSPEVVAPLIEALSDSDVNVRFEAASALGRVPDPRALEPLVKASNDSDEDVRRAACEALGGIKDDRARDALIDHLQSDRKAIVRGHAALGLGVMKASGAVDALVKRAARERDSEALAAMAWALGEIGDRKAKATLETLAKHASEVVQKQASEALAKLPAAP